MLAFEEMNETDVREEVITPLLSGLGYRSGTENNVIREQSLRYPRKFLGRKDLSKDPELRGKADYILEAKRKVRWVLEAKAPDGQITQDDIEQAWSYANHPEVRAVYFVLCNGRTLKIFQTVLAPAADPLVVVSYEELPQRYAEICGILSPDSLLRDFAVSDAKTGPPIGPGLRSVVRVTGGLIQYDKMTPEIHQVLDWQNPVVGGALERDERGRLVAFLETLSPLRSVQELNEHLGLSSFEMETEDTTL